MAEHLWFVPAAGGGLIHNPDLDPTLIPVDDREYINLQWAVLPFPNQVGLGSAHNAELTASVETTFSGNITGAAPMKLADCFARFSWFSTACEEETVCSGLKLMVGTVFANQLAKFDDYNDPVTPDTWDLVEVWAKFRLNDLNRFSYVDLTINGNPAGTPINQIGAAPAGGFINGGSGLASNAWFVAYAIKTGSWGTFTRPNLRAVLTVCGIDDSGAANAGLSIVDVEWMAFRLSSQDEP